MSASTVNVPVELEGNVLLAKTVMALGTMAAAIDMIDADAPARAREVLRAFVAKTFIEWGGSAGPFAEPKEATP